MTMIRRHWPLLAVAAILALAAPIALSKVPGNPMGSVVIIDADTFSQQAGVDSNGNLKVIVGTSQTGLTPVVSGSAEATHVLKATAGVLWSVYATNATGTAGFLMVTNTTSAPGDGAVTPLVCIPLPANGVASANFNPGPPQTYSTGISVSLSSNASCFAKTTGTITGFISGSVQ